MKRPVFRLACALAVLALLACGAYALTSGDSLISLSYLQNTFLPQAVSQGEKTAEEKLQQTYDSAKSTLDQTQKSYLAQITGGEEGGLYSGTLQARDWDEGDEVEVSTGSGVLMLEGAASVTHSGACIDVTTGAEVPSGGRLTANHRYLVGEDTLARITVLSGAAQIGVIGLAQVGSRGVDGHGHIGAGIAVGHREHVQFVELLLVDLDGSRRVDDHPAKLSSVNGLSH